MANNLEFDNSLEIHEDWLFELSTRRKKRSRNLELFCLNNNLDCREAFWFFTGNPVQEDAFKIICGILDVDWKKVQEPLPTPVNNPVSARINSPNSSNLAAAN